MAAAPWILLAVGIGIVILGVLIASLTGGSGRGYIDPRMSDREIERQLDAAQGNPIGGWVMLIGFLVVLVSIVWRIVRIFV